jgi:HEAT repeat protein
MKFIRVDKFNTPPHRVPLVRWFRTGLLIIFLILTSSLLFSQSSETAQRATIKFGTETEIAALVQTLRNENADYLDGELVSLIDTTKNARILNGILAFFAEREKSGLEDRAIRIINEREHETSETVLSAVNYLGMVKCENAAPVIMELLKANERRFFNAAFRALGKVSSKESGLSQETADFLIDFYKNRDPGDDNRSALIEAIGTAGSSAGVPMLTEIASNSSERLPLRIAALNALSKIADPEGLDAILGCSEDGDPNVRSAAIAALGPFSGEEVDKAVLDAFRDSYYRTRIAAAQASAERKFAAAVPYLQYRAERDDTPNVKDEAIKALGAIANSEASEVLENLFYENKNTDRVRILAAEMVMKIAPDRNLGKLIAELDNAKTKNQTALYNGLLKVLGETVVTGDISLMANITGRFLRSGGVVEKLYALDMAANNNISGFADEIKTLAKDRNEGIARRAQRAAERLGIDL